MSLQSLLTNQWFVNILLDFKMITLKSISAHELFLIVIPVEACPRGIGDGNP